ncbi:MAG TPA: alpha-ribazole phosphatase [Candidatus Saccharimonadales bacterium]|nr:alpha-ribazole phosphatase [Candidatus Saccharimonadales bacterium]
MRLYLLRHTPVKSSPAICYGQSEVALSSSYPTDLGQVRVKLKQLHFNAIVSSPLGRCKRLAEDLAIGDLVFDNRLLEFNFGDWEQKTWEQIGEGNIRQWADHLDAYHCPNGESYADLRKRTVSFWKDSIAQYPGKTILVVTHAGVIRCLLASALDMPLHNAFRLQIDYGSLSAITLANGQPRVLFTNR